jgi:signal peptidase I
MSSIDSPPSAAPEAPGPPSRRPRHRAPQPAWRARLLGWGLPIAVAVIIAVLLRTFVIGTFSIPSTSMVPTLQKGDRIIVDRLSLDMGGIHRGDVIVFRRTAPVLCGEAVDEYLVKRVIGLPGDRVSSSGNTVLIDGHPLAQPWLPKGQPLGPAIKPVTVPPNEYFVLGDNRTGSCDSRYWGEVPRGNIVGRAFARIWPLNRLGGL